MTDPPVEITFGDVWWPFFRSLFLDNNIVPNSSPWPATLWTFLGIALSFLVTRSVTRYIRHRSADGPVAGPVKDIVIGGVHIHHQVFGIILMTLTGIWLIAAQPDGVQLAVVAGLFGVGVGLAFDEFALWLHLHDVYWSPQGRVSIDAVAIVMVLTGQITVIVGVIHDLGDTPIDALTGEFGSVIIWLLITELACTFVPTVVCLLKGKPFAAGLGLMYIPIGLISMVRLAKPHSWWAKRVYRHETSRRMIRAHRRFDDAYQARWNRVRDFVGGAPTSGLPAAGASASTETTTSVDSPSGQTPSTEDRAR